MDFSQWFDVRNIDHLKAYDYFSKNGGWPGSFIPPYVKLDTGWQTKIINALALAWVDFQLYEAH